MNSARSGDSRDGSRLTRIIDFSEPMEIGRWTAVDDVVMGGLSSSGLRGTAHGTALFTGTVSLARGGGFASVRSDSRPRGLVGGTGFALRLRGDGKRYRMRLRTTLAEDGVSHLAPFVTVPGRWNELVLPTHAFVPTRRGQPVAGAPTLSLADVLGFGFLIDRQAGPFALEMAWVALAR